MSSSTDNAGPAASISGKALRQADGMKSKRPMGTDEPFTATAGSGDVTTGGVPPKPYSGHRPTSAQSSLLPVTVVHSDEGQGSSQ